MILEYYKAIFDEIDQELINCIQHRVMELEKVFETHKLSKEDAKELLKPDASLSFQNASPLAHKAVDQVFLSLKKLCETKLSPYEKTELLVKRNLESSFLSHFNLSPNKPILIAGPCAVENEKYLEEVAEVLKNRGFTFIRGGAFKPRTSPYDFQGLGKEGLRILRNVGDRYGLKVVTEVVNTKDVEIVSKYADVLQVGARNMHNFELLKAVGKSGHPVLLKRGLSATVDEWIYAAEYIAKEGNMKILMCERGIRTYETQTRNTLDLSSVAIVQQETHLPVMVDLSHSLGRKDIVVPIGKGALATGASGLMIEVHPCPEKALSDQHQQLNLLEFQYFLDEVFPSNLGEKRECRLLLSKI